MKKPILNQEERLEIIHDSYRGAHLRLYLELKRTKRALNIFEWWVFKRAFKTLLKASIKFKGWD